MIGGNIAVESPRLPGTFAVVDIEAGITFTSPASRH